MNSEMSESTQKQMDLLKCIEILHGSHRLNKMIIIYKKYTVSAFSVGDFLYNALVVLLTWINATSLKIKSS